VSDLVEAFKGTNMGWGLTLSHLARLQPELIKVNRKAHVRTYEPTEDGLAIIGSKEGILDGLQDEEPQD